MLCSESLELILRLLHRVLPLFGQNRRFKVLHSIFGVEKFLVFKVGHKWWDNFVIFQIILIDSGKERVCQDLPHPILAPQPCQTIFLQQPRNQIDQLIRVLNLVSIPIREDNLRVHDLAHKHLPLPVVERRHPDQHLVHEDAQCPPIDALVVA